MLRNALIFVGIALALFAQLTLAGDRDFPTWLGGKPDLDLRPDRCAVYEWFFNQADKQTEKTASKDDLASKRLINIANKLVDHHLSSPSERYSAEIKFLVIGRDRGPFDFEFQIANSELKQLMHKDCDE